MKPTNDFRSDINGLRAIAVLLVVLYHFDVPGFSGGFTGVDVFFVISGFLMTRIIATGIDAGRFATFSFYMARARRIIPALAVVCLAVMAYGAVRLTPPDFEQLGRHAAASIAFLSNLAYWREFGYFNADSHDKWLLHTWSLSVEWQFYLLYPLVLLAARRLWNRPSSTTWAIVGMFVASLALSIVLTPSRPTPAFYLIPTRAWEMLAGGLVFLLAQRGAGTRFAAAAGPVGLALIAASVLIFKPGDAWPGYYAVLPVLGSALVIWMNYSRSWLLSNPVAQFLGNASYSIYLWHWPLVVLLQYHGLGESAAWRGAGIALSVGLGWLSYLVIEGPVRNWSTRLSMPRSVAAFGSVCLVVLVAGGLVMKEHGVPQRMTMTGYLPLIAKVQFPTVRNGWCEPNKVDAAGLQVHDLAWQPEYAQCHVGDKTATREALLWGDSHAAHFSPFVSKMAEAEHVRVREFSAPACPPLFDGELGVNPEICKHFRDEVRGQLAHLDTIVLASRWDVPARQAGFAAQLRSTLQTLSSKGAHVIVLAQTPMFTTNVAKRYVNATLFGEATPDIYPVNAVVTRANEAVRSVVQEFPNATFVDPTAVLCTPDGCSTKIDGVMAFYDDNHLNIIGAQTLAQLALAHGHSLFVQD